MNGGLIIISKDLALHIGRLTILSILLIGKLVYTLRQLNHTGININHISRRCEDAGGTSCMIIFKNSCGETGSIGMLLITYVIICLFNFQCNCQICTSINDKVSKPMQQYFSSISNVFVNILYMVLKVIIKVAYLNKVIVFAFAYLSTAFIFSFNFQCMCQIYTKSNNKGS